MDAFSVRTKIMIGGGMDALAQRLHRVFLVTDKFMAESGKTNYVTDRLLRNGGEFKIFSDVQADPDIATVTRGVEQILEFQPDAVVAFGGGSAIDAAKAIVFFAARERDMRDCKFIAIPTTSGTGSEVTSIAVITDKVNSVKIPLNDEMLIPDAAILDARFTRTVPPHVTAATGMDVLTHAVEAYTSRYSNVFTAIYAEQAIRNVFTYLKRAYDHGDDMTARDNMLIGSCMAGLAFTNSGLGVTHSMAHSLGGLFHIPHGLANAVLLPFVIGFNSFDAGVKYTEIAAFIGLESTTVEEGTRNLINAVRDLNTSMKIPARVRELKVDEQVYRQSLDSMAANALEDICTSSNPRMPSHDDIVTLLEQAW